MILPEKFLETMRELLGAEFSEYMRCMEKPSQAALRINTNKISIEQFQKISPFPLEQIPWTAKGFYFDEAKVQPAKHPYYYAGLYYIQEASAMIPASLLPVHRGDKLLDLCAAPGGKATELAAKLENTGLLVANDISASRAMALAKNLQMAGSRNTVVTVEEPERLAMKLPGYFDGILVDAPCSGEGMFRRDGRMVQDWMEHGPAYYVKMQKKILTSAYQMLRPGGMMVYSTCTFSTQEDEGMVAWFLNEFSDMRICPVKRQEGFSEGVPEWGGTIEKRRDSLRECVRIFPHRARGEGHFAVLMQKEEKKRRDFHSSPKMKDENLDHTQEVDELFDLLSRCSKQKLFLMKKKQIYLACTAEMSDLNGFRQISSGVILGEQKKNHFERSHQLAFAIDPKEVEVVDLPASDDRVLRFLRGETIFMEECPKKGYVLFCVDGFPLGWCKGDGKGRFKNKIYPGWRMDGI